MFTYLKFLLLFPFFCTRLFISLKTKTNYITHRFLIDPKLDSELKEIENKIERNNLWPQIANAFSWDWSHHGPYKESDRMRNIIQTLDLDFKQYLVQD